MEDENAGIYAWAQERIQRGALDPIAMARITRALRYLPRSLSKHFAWLGTEEGRPREGPYRVETIPFARANAYVQQRHRHLNGVVGHLFSLGLVDDVGIRGVCIVGRPVARHLDDGQTAEITRLATDGSRNACSALLGRARRKILEMGFRRIITYTLPNESGASLRGAGFRIDKATKGGSWTRPTRERNDTHPLEGKTRWIWERER